MVGVFVAPVDVFVPPFRMLDSAVNALVSANPATAAGSSSLQPGQGFTLVDKSGAEKAVQAGGLGRKLRMTAELFDLISSNGEFRKFAVNLHSDVIGRVGVVPHGGGARRAGGVRAVQGGDGSGASASVARPVCYHTSGLV